MLSLVINFARLFFVFKKKCFYLYVIETITNKNMITKDDEIRIHKAIKADTVKANIEHQLNKIEAGADFSPSYFKGLLQAYLEQLTVK